MKKLILSIFVILFIPVSLVSQTVEYKYTLPLVKYGENVNLPLTQKELNQIIEVYGDDAEKEVLSRPQRLKDIKHLLRNRIEFKMLPEGNLKPFRLLSEIPLFNFYVTTLKRDLVFNPENFNPLKYNIEYFSTIGTTIKIDNTNYYLIIKSQHQ